MKNMALRILKNIRLDLVHARKTGNGLLPQRVCPKLVEIMPSERHLVTRL